MKVTKRINTATIVIDFSDPESCQDALSFIASNSGMSSDNNVAFEYDKSYGHFSGKDIARTSRVRIIKFIRAYGNFIVENGGKSGLKSAKDYFEKHEEDLIIND
tara:strand:- start:839 stop:1150 length:312 start_codon:yes stop_codon:yes gene_type:complete